MKNKKNGSQNHGKPYPTPPKKHSNRPNNQRIVVMGFASSSGSKPTTFSTQIIIFRCGKPGHISSNCTEKDKICFNYR